MSLGALSGTELPSIKERASLKAQTYEYGFLQAQTLLLRQASEEGWHLDWC